MFNRKYIYFFYIFGKQKFHVVTVQSFFCLINPKNILHMETKILKLHLFYIILILSMIIIELLTFHYGDNTNLVSYLSFAGMICSIILALLAIVYSIYSTSNLSQSLGDLHSLSQMFTETSATISRTTMELERKIIDIPIVLEEVKTKLTEKDEKFESILIQLQSSQVSKTVETPENKDIDKLVETYLQSSSVFGQLLLYSCCLSYKTQIPFTMKKLAELSKLPSPNIDLYMNGYFISSASFGLFKYQQSEESFLITEINRVLENLIKNIIYAVAERYDTVNPPTWVKYKDMITAIELYFVQPPA